MKQLDDNQVKPTLVKTMAKLHNFCEENGIKYYLHAGTLLGAVRHKGFIPWDDDMDISMPRADYNRFIELTNAKDCGFDFYCNERDKNYTYAFGKVCDRDTIVVETERKNIQTGLYIDIFPLDYVPEDYNSAVKFVKKCHTYSNFYLCAGYRKYVGSKTGGIRKIIKPFAYMIAKIFGVNFWINKLNKLSQKYSDTNSKYIASCFSPDGITVYEAQWYSERELLNFEEYKFAVPKEYDKVLTRRYGDYMKLPPVEKQVAHHDYAVYIKD